MISSDIADIFKSNALKNGLLPIVVDKKAHRELLNFPGCEVTIDLEDQVIKFGDGWTCIFEVEPFGRRCLLDGVDPLGYLLDQMPEIHQFEEVRSRASVLPISLAMALVQKSPMRPDK